MSQNSRVAYIKRQVENINSNNEILNNEGDFEYTEDKFVLKCRGASKFYAWEEIVEINAYKVDLITTDDIRLDISFSDVILIISEDIPGWSLFIDKLMRALPAIANDWEEMVTESPFAANKTMIYKKYSLSP